VSVASRTPDVKSLLQTGGRRSIDDIVLAKMIDAYGAQVAYAVGARQVEVLEKYYVKASKIPKTTTMQSFGYSGYIINGPLHGNESLIICFDTNAKPNLLKRLYNEEEISRVRKFSDTAFNCEHVTRFTFTQSCTGDAVMMMPMYPATLHSLDISTRTGSIVGKLITHISVALDALHAIGFCHMDIKPSNIAIDYEGNLVLIDLGSVAQTGEPTESTELFLPVEDRGTSGRYVATEKRDWQMLSLTVYSKVASDSWSGNNRIPERKLQEFLRTTDCEGFVSLLARITVQE
jgi:serine/threonine protein kinase